jgi:hypothetical protein
VIAAVATRGSNLVDAQVPKMVQNALDREGVGRDHFAFAGAVPVCGRRLRPQTIQREGFVLRARADTSAEGGRHAHGGHDAASNDRHHLMS